MPPRTNADKQEQHYKSAGLHLIEAKQRIEAGEYDGSFSKFITQECNCPYLQLPGGGNVLRLEPTEAGRAAIP